MAASTLKYVSDTSEARRFIIHSWRNSKHAARVLGPIVDQKESCFCYGITMAESSHAVINLKKNVDIPRLSAMEICNNCFEIACKGYQAPIAAEFARQTGIAEYSRMPLMVNQTQTRGLADGTHHKIDEWEVLPNCDAAMLSYSVKQLVVVSLYCDTSLFAEYNGGLVDPFLMEKEAGGSGQEHSMLISGFGFYIFPDKQLKYFWELKNSMGTTCGDEGYIDVLRNSSQPVEKWIKFDPLVPLVFAPGENYVSQHLVVELSFEELAKFEANPNLDIVIMFYDGVRDGRAIFEDFERVSRFYLPEKDDTKLY